MLNETKTFETACITTASVSTNGYQGGDAGHGCMVELKLDGEGSTSMAVVITKGGEQIDLDDIETVTLRLQGDCELDNLISAVEFWHEALQKIKRR